MLFMYCVVHLQQRLSHKHLSLPSCFLSSLAIILSGAYMATEYHIMVLSKVVTDTGVSVGYISSQYRPGIVCIIQRIISSLKSGSLVR